MPLARVCGKDTLFRHLLCQEGSHKPRAQLKPIFLALGAAELLPQTKCQGRAKTPGGICALGLSRVTISSSSPISHGITYPDPLSLAAQCCHPTSHWGCLVLSPPSATQAWNNSSLQRERSWFSQLSAEMSVHACLEQKGLR